MSDSRIAARAAYVLRGNDLGQMTAAAPNLYPHMWSWDAAFVAIGLATVSVPRAVEEMRSLLRAQWRTGMIPHIVFSGAPGYFPGPERWGADEADAAPDGVRTSGICQPPVHAIAVRRIVHTALRVGGDEHELATRFAREAFEPLVRWHEWLASARDPDETGLVKICHGWESGMDNSPRWDSAYDAVVPGDDLPPFARRDLHHVTDATERPSDHEYARYLWLVEQLRSVRYDDAALRDVVDFWVADVFMSAVLALASEELALLGDELGERGRADRMRALAERFRGGVEKTVSPCTGLARDYDVRAGQWVDAETIAGFAPLLCSSDAHLVAEQTRLFWGDRWCGHPELRYPLPPSTSPASPGFHPRQYWRGPVWPVMSWLFAWAFERGGDLDAAHRLHSATVQQLSDLAFGEYYEPFRGEPLGSRGQSWTAAVALDVLAG